MKLEAGQVWQLDTQEEFDAFVKLKDEQELPWILAHWTFEWLREQNRNLKVYTVEVGAVNYINPTHYGKYLLKEDNMFKVGDRVEVVKGILEIIEKHVGKEGLITRIDSDGTNLVELDGCNKEYWYEVEELELVKEFKWQEVERDEDIGSKNDTIIIEQHKETKELRVKGCFIGTLDEFETALSKLEDNEYKIVCRWLIENKYKAKYPDYKKKEPKWIVRGACGEGFFGKFIDLPKHDEGCKDDAKVFTNLKQAVLVAELIGGTVEEVKL